MTKFNYSNPSEIPKIKKIIVNKSFDDSCQNKKVIDSFLNEINLITCQYPKLSRAKKAIANFKLRKGTIIGMYVNLRKKKMYSFLDRLINISFPRIRDFQGISTKSFDDYGNYNLGLAEQIIFADVDFDKIVKISGLNITIVTNCKTKEESYALLRELGMPFKRI